MKINIGGLTREEWLELRRSGLGGSDAAAIMGLNPYISPMSVYLDKIGELPEKLEPDNRFIEWGNRLEPVVAEYFQDKHRDEGLQVVKDEHMYISDEYPFMLGNLDREIWNPDGSIDGLEIKTTSINNKDKWQDGNAPMHYLIQVQHYLAVRPDIEKFYMACLIGGSDYVELTVYRNEDILKTLKEVEGEFWERVQRGEAPGYSGTDGDSEILASLYPLANKGETVDLTFTHLNNVETYKNLDNQIKDMQKQLNELTGLRDSAKQEIIAAMGTAELATIGDYQVKYPTVITNGHWVKDRTYRRFSVK